MKTYLVRLNLDIKEKDYTEALRFKVAASAIKSISDKNNKVVILSHAGRPSRRDMHSSLKKFAPALSKEVGKKVVFIPNFRFRRIKQEIDSSPGGTIFLLENLRFLPSERNNSAALSKKLASLGDVYINNDFATSHRKSASIVGITRYIPSEMGDVLKEEIKALTKASEAPKEPFVLVVGGAKVKDKVGTIKHLLPRVDYVLLGGGAGNTLLKARGIDIGKSLYEASIVKKVKNISRSEKVFTPIDYVTEKGKILDIGPKTRNLYSYIISEARTIVWAGPMGVVERKKFSKGTEEIAEAIFKNKKAHTIIGGAETVSGLPRKITKQDNGNVFVSTGGGAMLHFLAGETPVAVKALKKRK